MPTHARQAIAVAATISLVLDGACSIASVGFREQAMDQAAEEESLKKDILALAPFMRAHADRFSKEDLAQYSAQLERFGGDPLDVVAA